MMIIWSFFLTVQCAECESHNTRTHSLGCCWQCECKSQQQRPASILRPHPPSSFILLPAPGSCGQGMSASSLPQSCAKVCVCLLSEGLVQTGVFWNHRVKLTLCRAMKIERVWAGSFECQIVSQVAQEYHASSEGNVSHEDKFQSNCNNIQWI